MGDVTEIGWTDSTFNPWIGCQEVSPACDFCYAKTQNKHRGWVKGWGPEGERKRTGTDNWRKPLRWNREAEADGTRRGVFCASLADVFDNKVPFEWRVELWQLIAFTPWLDWQLLTKRPQNIAKMLPASYGMAVAEKLPWPWPNVWLGTTVENQEEADRRIPHLLAVPAKVHFLSMEPLLGPVRLQDISLAGHHGMGKDHVMNTLRGESWRWGAEGVRYDLVKGSRRIKWTITGGESGPHARDNDFLINARSIRDQCRAAGVPIFVKQNVKKAPLPEDLMVKEFPCAA